jgi:hypothetical protein
MSALEDTLLGTLQLLEWRLHRLEFLLHADNDKSSDGDDHDEDDEKEDTDTGTDTDDEDTDKNATADTDTDEAKHEASEPVIPRLQQLERALRQLANKSEVVSDLLKLRAL